jgi:hypothetical protein
MHVMQADMHVKCAACLHECRFSRSPCSVTVLHLVAATLLSRGYVAAMAAAVLEHAVEQHLMPQFKASLGATVSWHHWHPCTNRVTLR